MPTKQSIANLMQGVASGTATIKLKQRTGCFVALATIEHRSNGKMSLVYSQLWDDTDMQLLADTGARMPGWWQPSHRIAIVGSRDYPNNEHIVNYVNRLPDNTIIVSGGARGVDTIAEQSAKMRGLETIIYPVDKTNLPSGQEGRREYGRRAFARNTDIVNACDSLVAFWDGKSKGTKHSIDLARNQGKPVDIIKPVVQVSYSVADDLDIIFDMSKPDSEVNEAIDRTVKGYE